MKELAPGIFKMSMEDYLKHPAYSRTTLVNALESAAKAKATIDAEKETTDPMRLGTATHFAFLEAAGVAKHFALYRGKPDDHGKYPAKIIRAGSQWEIHKGNALSQGLDPHLTMDQYNHALSMGEALRINPVTQHLFNRKPARTEITIVFEIEILGVKIPIKVRIDRLIQDEFPTQADIKTTASVSDHKFSRSIIDFGYDIQAWLYRKAFIARTKLEVTNFVIAAVEKKATIMVGDKLTHAVRVFDMAPWLKGGEQRGLEALAVIAKSIANNEWPSYPARVESLEPPDWYIKKYEGRR